MEHIEKSRFAHVGQSAQESESIKRQSLTFMQDAMRRLWKNKVAVVCVAVILAADGDEHLCADGFQIRLSRAALQPHQRPDGHGLQRKRRGGRRPRALFRHGYARPRHLHPHLDGRPRVADHRRGQRAGRSDSGQHLRRRLRLLRRHAGYHYDAPAGDHQRYSVPDYRHSADDDPQDPA